MLDNFYSVSGEAVVKVLAAPPVPLPIRITYGSPSGGSLTVKKESDGSVLPSGSLLPAGTRIRIEVKAYSYFKLGSLLNGNSVGAVTEYRLRDIQGDATIEAVFSNPGIPVYTLSSRVVGKGGYVTPTLVRVAKGSNHQFVIHTVDKEMLLDVQIGTKEKMKSIGTPGSYIFRSVSADSILVASFGTQPTNMEDPGMEGESRLYAIGGCLYVQPLVAGAVLRVYSLSGQLVLQQRLAGTSVVQILPEGVYVAELKENNSAIRVKIKIAH